MAMYYICCFYFPSLQGSFVVKVKGPDGWLWNPENVSNKNEDCCFHHFDRDCVLIHFPRNLSLLCVSTCPYHHYISMLQFPVTVDQMGCNLNADINFQLTGFGCSKYVDAKLNSLSCNSRYMMLFILHSYITN